MKVLLLCLSFLFSISLNAQKIALLDKEFQKPIIYTDSVTVEQITTGYFPLSVENFDTMYANLKYIDKMLKIRQRAKMVSFELRAGSTTLKIDRIIFAYGDKYDIVAKTKVGEVESNFLLVSSKTSEKKSAKRVERLMDYMSKNKSLFKSPNEIQPKLYNIIVVTDH